PAAPGGATPPAGTGTAAAPGAGAPSASASAAPAAGTPPTGPTSGEPKGVRVQRGAPPPPAPSKEQLEALKSLQEELKEYEKGAKIYRKTLTMIVRHHYEERRRRVLTALDREIDTEQKNLIAARTEAIKRLEEFIERYS